MARTLTGIGPALRRSREKRGTTLEEASRETKIRPELLRALESERFAALPGKVYVRGFLRSYSQYLGLDPDKVVARYDDYEDQLGPLEEDSRPGPFLSDQPIEPELRPHGASSWILAVGIAATLFILAAATGLLSGSTSMPDPVRLPVARVTSPPPPAGRVAMELLVGHEVDAVITVDGTVEYRGALLAKEARTYRAGHSIRLQLSRGNSVRVTVNRTPLGAPGTSDQPLDVTYTPESGIGARNRSLTPSPGSSPSPSPSLSASLTPSPTPPDRERQRERQKADREEERRKEKERPKQEGSSR